MSVAGDMACDNLVDLRSWRHDRGLPCACATCRACAAHGEEWRGVLDLLEPIREAEKEREDLRSVMRGDGVIGWFLALFV